MELKTKVDEYVLTKPNFTTTINYGHVAKVVSVQALVDDGDNVLKKTGFEMKSTGQVKRNLNLLNIYFNFHLTCLTKTNEVSSL